jgi:hypothetical protein
LRINEINEYSLLTEEQQRALLRITDYEERRKQSITWVTERVVELERIRKAEEERTNMALKKHQKNRRRRQRRAR